MKAFITGGTGFVGTHIIQELDKDGWEIIALHRKNSDLTELKKCQKVQFVLGDITDIQSLRLAIPENVDAVFHTAGSVANLPHAQENTRYDINLEGTKNVVQVCLEKHIGKMIYTSTVVTYDFHQKGKINESFPKNYWSKDQYVNSKRLAEDEVEKAQAKGLRVVYLHPSAIFGAYDKQTWSKMFLEIERGLPLPFAPPGGGSVCHARKVARAHVDAYSKGKPGEHYILGGPDVTWIEVTKAIAKILRRKAPIAALPNLIFRAYGTLEFLISTQIGREPTLTPHIIDLLTEYIYSDSSKAIRELNYNPSSLEEMLSDCYEWMLKSKMIHR